MQPKAYYDSQCHHGASVDRRIDKAADLLLRHAPSNPRFLDIGCGAGAATRAIGDRLSAVSLAGIDIAETLVNQARTNGIDASAVDLDSEDIPFPEGSFDAIHCGEVIEHLVDTDHLLDEIARLLSPAGVCALSTPNLAAWHNRAALLLGYQPFLSEVSFRHAAGRPPFAQAGEGGGHLRMFTRRALLELVRLHGFEVVAERGVGVFELGDPPGSMFAKRLIAPLDAFFTRIPSLACDTLIAFRKRA
jgi:SAM-dependent methyltransferase